MFKKIKLLGKRIEDLEKVIPKMYSLLVKSVPNLPCGHFKECICNNCNKVECAYNPNTTITKTTEEYIEEFLHF